MVNRVEYGSTTNGYIVNQVYLETLLDNFREGEQNLTKQVLQFSKTNPNTRLFAPGETALDQHWKILQEKDRFYSFTPEIGRQSGIASSIMSHNG